MIFIQEIYGVFNLDQIDMRSIEFWLNYLPVERKNKALQFRQEIDKKNCIVSYLLLIYGIKKKFGIQMPRIECGDNGKPYLPDLPEIYFNISHCKKGCICGIADAPIGVDVQEIRPFSLQIAKYCCTKKELELLFQSEEPARLFTKMWVMKESYLKMLGRGITTKLNDVDTTELENKFLFYMSNDCYIAVANSKLF